MLISECTKRVNEGEVTEDDIIKLLEWTLETIEIAGEELKQGLEETVKGCQTHYEQLKDNHDEGGETNGVDFTQDN